MCGIAGIINKELDYQVDWKILFNMVDKIQHRGPDDYGLFIERNVGIGMRRLSIIDVQGGAQPIHNENKSKWIVFNGEIYNFKILTKELNDLGHNFYTASDTEVIIHLYEEYGEDCVRFLRGMFAFAIWDDDKKHLFLARDRLGIKPLHYYCDEKKFIFGSEIKSILAYDNFERSIFLPSLASYISLGFVCDPDTIFQNIHKLPPAHYLIYKDGKASIKKYWNVTFNNNRCCGSEFIASRGEMPKK